jgi:hypothetical protein
MCQALELIEHIIGNSLHYLIHKGVFFLSHSRKVMVIEGRDELHDEIHHLEIGGYLLWDDRPSMKILFVVFVLLLDVDPLLVFSLLDCLLHK